MKKRIINLSFPRIFFISEIKYHIIIIMRLAEAISFLQKNPTGDELSLMTHIDVSALKLKMKKDKEFGKFVKKCRKDYKEKDIIKTEVIDLFSDLE